MALVWNFEGRSRRVRHPRRGVRLADVELARTDRHPLGRPGVEPELPRVDDAGRHAPPMALEPDALDLTVEVRVVFQHGPCPIPTFFRLQSRALRAKLDRPNPRG